MTLLVNKKLNKILFHFKFVIHSCWEADSFCFRFNFFLIHIDQYAKYARDLQEYLLLQASYPFGTEFFFLTQDYDFHRGKSEYEDVLQCNNSPSSATARGHQTPAAFLIEASGLEKVKFFLYKAFYLCIRESCINFVLIDGYKGF